MGFVEVQDAAEAGDATRKSAISLLQVPSSFILCFLYFTYLCVCVLVFVYICIYEHICGCNQIIIFTFTFMIFVFAIRTQNNVGSLF